MQEVTVKRGKALYLGGEEKAVDVELVDELKSECWVSWVVIAEGGG
jgi:hypothetical protein